MSGPLKNLSKVKHNPLKSKANQREDAALLESSKRELIYSHSPISDDRMTPSTPVSDVSSRCSSRIPKEQGKYDEDKLLSELATSLAEEAHRQRQRTSHMSNGRIDSYITDQDLSDEALMTQMIGRISLLEARCAIQQKEISDKEKRIRVLEEKYNLLKKIKGSNEDEGVKQLTDKCARLQQQVHEMEAFLADYGMQWVGDSEPNELDNFTQTSNDLETDESHLDTDRVWRPATSHVMELDFNAILQNIEELNILAGEGESRIEHTNSGARIKPLDSVPLTLYANGMMLWNGPFRPYDEPQTQQFISDLRDGFFPSELQKKYPDGVPFQVSDKRSTEFTSRRRVFEGAGQVLGGSEGLSRLVPSGLHDHSKPRSSSLNTESQLPGPQMTVNQFLQKLPSSVVRDGKVIDIRQGVGQQLQNFQEKKATTVKVIETDAMKDLQERVKSASAANPIVTPRNLATLRITMETGDQLIVKTEFDETISVVKAYVKNNRPASAPDFDLVLPYPKTILRDESKTIEEYGLVPNAALRVHIKK